MSDGVDGRVNRIGSPRLFGLKGRCLEAKLTPSYVPLYSSIRLTTGVLGLAASLSPDEFVKF